MSTFILRRLLLVPPTILGIITIAFFASRMGGVSPARVMHPKATAEYIQQVEKENGWDKPLVVQFGHYLKQLSKGDLGDNLVVSSHSVVEELKTRFPATIELSLVAMLLAIVIGIPIGVLAAVKANSWFDYTSMSMALAGVSIPVFWLAMLLILAFGQVLPFDGRNDTILALTEDFHEVTNFLVVDAVLSGNMKIIKDIFMHLLLPSLALCTIPLAMIARITRASMLEILGEDYVRTARAKGLPFRKVVFHHALKNAMPQINTAIGLQTGYLLAGAILTESIFRWPGLGTYVLDTAQNRDFNGLQGSVMLLAIIFLFVNVLVDLSYAFFDPRISVS